ncbi:MAG: alcohol dehydrogenase catalytic domain-containing protein [Lachnospiraceae bacterium]|nr:alcohol dehydrogenase catalytic domain-containing protein [Lachnospiraceae bacterium]
MLAGIIYGLHDYRLGEAEMPKIQEPTDVLLKVTATAICTSEVHYAEGFQPLTAPFTTGHEFVGTIIETGSSTWLRLLRMCSHCPSLTRHLTQERVLRACFKD